MRPQVAMRILAAALLASGVAGASTRTAGREGTGSDVTSQVMRAVDLYSGYGVFDAVSFRVDNGVVQLHGAVTEPVKKADIGRLAAQVAGVTGVDNEIRVLPVSPADDRLRAQVARAIFGDQVLGQYSMGPDTSIHIVVDRGHVELAGIVHTEPDKALAAIRAGGAGMNFGPIVNDLQVE
jgi:hyperosmotically inducible periplasmic protein